MLLPLALSILAAAAAAPATYDERQDGEFNVRADVQNVVLLVALPQKTPFPSSILDGWLKSAKPAREAEVQERADVHVMEAFVEPSTPYHVEIGAESGRAVEVVIAGRRRPGPGPAAEDDEMKLLGATEQCGPDRERDPVTLVCRARASPAQDADSEAQTEPEQPAATPEVVPASS
ncbi:uncharacterized protein LOC114355006 [Ostrinia furnacalis]|uniref:uncharacterized protein LOC114355006 n=1 Tax=Ostrinia furnacalis TaxID=93504 RepID=UPI00103DE82A|nr:uncharacterized protein LOC114355006 [Ostrinia furnacalis]